MPLNKETLLQYPAVTGPTLSNATVQLSLMLTVVAIYIQIYILIHICNITTNYLFMYHIYMIYHVSYMIPL